MNRRQFVKTIGSAAALGTLPAAAAAQISRAAQPIATSNTAVRQAPVVLQAAPTPAPSPAPGPAASSSRSYAARSFALELGGADAGHVRSFAGGNITAPVVTEPAAAGSRVLRKHIGAPRYEPFVLEIDMPPHAAVAS